MTFKLEPRPATVYRIYSADDQLLYVGCSTNWPQRLYQHQLGRPWWRDAARVTLEHFEHIREARDVEARATLVENPLHNIIRGRRLPPERLAVRNERCRATFERNMRREYERVNAEQAAENAAREASA